MEQLIKKVETAFQPSEEREIDNFKAGDTINIHLKVREVSKDGKPKERIQQFKGVVIQRRNSGNNETFTVRKISNGIEVERIFPLAIPNIIKIERLSEGIVRRARIFYLRGRKGKQAKVKQRIISKK